MSLEQTVKTKMANLGWTVEETISKNGYTVKVKRADWNGMNAMLITGHSVCFTASTTNINPKASDMLLTLISAYNTATKAYEKYTDTIPYQTATGEIKTDMAFEHWLRTIGE